MKLSHLIPAGVALSFLSLTACQETPAAKGSSPTVARVGDTVISLDDLDQAIRGDLYRLRAETLHQLITLRMEETMATEKGISVSQLRTREVDDKVSTPSEEALVAAFETAKSAGSVPPEVTLAQVREQLVDFLTISERDALKEQYLDGLYLHYKVRFDLDALGRPDTPLRQGGPSRGPENAAVTIIEYTDFNAKFTKAGHETMKKVLDSYPQEVRVLFRHKIGKSDSVGMQAAEAALCANDQGKYWEYRELLFAHQNELKDEMFTRHAAALQLDELVFRECMETHRHSEDVEADTYEARRFGLGGSPVYTVNGTPLSGAHEFRMFRRLIELERKNLTERRSVDVALIESTRQKG